MVDLLFLSVRDKLTLDHCGSLVHYPWKRGQKIDSIQAGEVDEDYTLNATYHLRRLYALP